MPHGRQQGAYGDVLAPNLGCGNARLETGEGVGDDLIEGQPAFEVLFRREAHLGVHDAVVGQILGALARHPEQPLGGLHDGHGVREGLEVALERSAVRCVAEPLPQSGTVGRG